MFVRSWTGRVAVRVAERRPAIPRDQTMADIGYE